MKTINFKASSAFRINLRRICAKKGITQGVLAERTGLARITINRFLQGKTQPQLDEAQEIAEAIGVSLNRLLDEPPAPAPEIPWESA
jgi:transcriptional regulator with XRE-family HTH domain